MGEDILQPHSVFFSSAVNAVNMAPKISTYRQSYSIIRAVSTFSRRARSFPIMDLRIRSLIRQSISYDCSKMAGSSSFTMRMISFIKGYSKDTVISSSAVSFHYISSSYCFGSGCLVSDNQSAGSQFYTSKVTDHYNKDIRQLIGIYLPQNRLSCGTRRLSVIICSEILPFMPQHISVTHMAGIVIFLLIRVKMLLLFPLLVRTGMAIAINLLRFSVYMPSAMSVMVL